MARRPRPPPISPITWRDGVHLTGTPIWCDARRRRDVCFVSSADRVGRTGHGQLIGTPITLAMLGASGHGHLAVPVRKRFTLGMLRLELVPSGRMLGAAALHIDLGGRTVLYAGAIRPPEADVRTSDAVVVAAPYGERHHKLRKLDDVADELVGWIRNNLDRRPNLVVDTALDGLELAGRLASEAIPVAGSRAIREAALRAAVLAPVPALKAREPTATVRLASERGAGLAALVSARALEGYAGFDAGFAWPHVADRAQLLAWIEATGAQQVFVTGACAQAIVAALGPRARVLGPPAQMTLFPREAAP
jgi:putative mRNA 3-end processing factor